MGKTFVRILVSIILAIFIISFINIGARLIYPDPEYDDFCEDARIPKLEFNETEQIEFEERNRECYDSYDAARDGWNQTMFFVFAFFGLVGILYGLFKQSMIEQIVGLAAGGFLAIEGIVINSEETLSIFIALGFLILFTILFIRKRLKTK